MSGNQNDIENLESNEEVHDTTLDKEDKLRIIKGLILIFLFSSVVIASMVYYNAPNYNPNLVFEGVHDEDIRHDKHLHDNPVYKLQSRLSRKNFIQLDLFLERIGKQTFDSQPVEDIKLIITLAKNRARIHITKSKTGSEEFEIPQSLLNYQDLDFEKDGKIEDIADSNIGVHINHHPFSFYLYRKDTDEKLFDTSHSSESKDFNHYFYYAENFVQISTRLPTNHYTYGLGERFSSLRLKSGRYLLWANDPFNGGKANADSTLSGYSSMPNFITLNPTTLNSFGCAMFNSSPMEVLLENDYLTYKMTSGVVDLFIFNGPRPKDIIVQYQKTFGLPVLPPFNEMNWQGNVITGQPVRDLNYISDIYAKKDKESSKVNSIPLGGFWIDYADEVNEGTFKGIEKSIGELNESGYKIFTYKRSPLSTKSKLFPLAKEKSLCMSSGNEAYIGKTSYGDACVVNYHSDYSLEFTQKQFINQTDFEYNYERVMLLMNEPTIACGDNCDKRSSIKLPFYPGGKPEQLEANTVPLNIKQKDNSLYSGLNTHNIYGLHETQVYSNALSDIVPRPMIFSRSSFTGAQQYAGKWLGYLENSWSGLKLAIVQTINFNLLGNHNVAHEACGYSKISKSTDGDSSREIEKEVCLRWLQFSSVLPHARLNYPDLIPLLSGANWRSAEMSFRLRAMLNVYLYSYMLRMHLEGGSIIMPMFADFKSELKKDELHELDSQFMIGAYLMASPIIKPNERKKRTFFPADRFFDFYDGSVVSLEGEEFKDVDAPLDKLPLFAREGFILPFQSPPTVLTTFEKMRALPIELNFALDRNFHAAGKIYIDDGITSFADRKKEYFRMDIVAIHHPELKEIEIIFKKMTNFQLPKGEYPNFSNFHFSGFEEPPARLSYHKKSSIEQDDQGAKEEIKDISPEKLKWNPNTKTLDVSLEDLNLPLNGEKPYRVIIHGI